MTAIVQKAVRRQFHWHGLHVPFIAPWSGENILPFKIVTTVQRNGAACIGYADELSQADRRDGNLWFRQAVAQGSGEPDLGSVHPLRQRQAMSHMLCQVCGKSTYDQDFKRWGERHLFLVRAVDGRPLSDGEVTTTPPICEPCAVESVRACPHLHSGYSAALVKRAEPWGVAGILYSPATLQPVYSHTKDGLTDVPFESPLIRWTQAARDVASLHGCTPITLDDLAAYGVAT